MPLAAELYRLALAFWVGGVALFTFILTPALFKTQPRDLAGRIVGVLFPGYFRWGLAWGTIALATRLLHPAPYRLPSLVLLALMLAATAFQAFFIEPRAAALKKEIPSFATTSREDPLRRSFSRLHAFSALCNLLVFIGGVVLVLLQ